MPATPGLLPSLLRRIGESGPLGFATFMEQALYHPDFGYYSDPRRRIGRHGDFFTSVSVGPVFATILARWALAGWRILGQPERWRIAEAGSHDGTLIRELVAELRRLEPAASSGLTITTPEPLATRRALLQPSLAGLPVAAVEVIDPAAGPAPDPLPGLVIANEVLDALPCHLVEFGGDSWAELAVDATDHGRLALVSRNILDDTLAAAVARLGNAFPAGYRTEVRTGLEAFLQPLRDLLLRGSLLFFDYGFARDEFYHPDRREGTLRTFCRHQAGDDPLATPGERDLTAHVDFTAVGEAARALDMQVARFQPQQNFLTEQGREWIIALEHAPPEDRAASVRQFQTLTHPAHLGMRFHALELAWRIPTDPDQAADARRRLW